MSEIAELPRTPAAEPDEDNAKRRQIIEGANAVFMSRGFDAASMMDIAKAAGVSKGTLYVYFKDKVELFSAIVQQKCCTQAENTFVFDENDHDVEAALMRTGVEYMRFLCDPEKASTLRTIMAIAERMPEMGKAFYETGPANGIARLKTYLDAQVRAGVLTIEDTELAAAQFLDMCQSTLFKPVVFNFMPAPSLERIRYVIGSAVRTFMAAYRAK
jgi:AcrR family transcriptional regulator